MTLTVKKKERMRVKYSEKNTIDGAGFNRIVIFIKAHCHSLTLSIVTNKRDTVSDFKLLEKENGA